MYLVYDSDYDYDDCKMFSITICDFDNDEFYVTTFEISSDDDFAIVIDDDNNAMMVCIGDDKDDRWKFSNSSFIFNVGEFTVNYSDDIQEPAKHSEGKLFKRYDFTREIMPVLK